MLPKWGQLTSPPTVNIMDENHQWKSLPQMVPGYSTYLLNVLITKAHNFGKYIIFAFAVSL